MKDKMERCIEAGFEPAKGHGPTEELIGKLAETDAVREALWALNMVNSENADFVACLTSLLTNGGVA